MDNSFNNWNNNAGRDVNIQINQDQPEKVATVSKAQVQEIAELKMEDLNAASLEAAMRMIEGTARSMGILVGE